ncbi:hypothetical protein [Streptomyces rishiriensis]|uniref:hypothetical protein n=1 Tax=Streptomyces rishiriensis TaxID=68264 RepID=UPI0027D80C95|nr:hypothetical protein [Streptomyces rishiriensis]
MAVGYGPALSLLALTLLGALSFGARSANPVQLDEGAKSQPLVYTLDLLLPVGGLGQRTAWWWSNDSIQGLAYLLIASGWVLTTAVIAGVTRTLQKKN